MCGLAGIIRVTPAGAERRPIPESWLDRLESGIVWRGPDGRGRWRDDAARPDGSHVDVALVHTRLSIIDLEGGHQPMISERGPGPDGGGLVSVVFNGCIYNHTSLRTELAAAGHRFETDHSDTEVLLHGWRQWGERLADHLDGMYAICLWDRARAQCVLLRDRSGEKPLYYASPDNGRTLVFASAIPAILDVLREAGEPSPELDAEALVDWIRLGWGDRLPYKNIVEAAPRETLVFPDNNPSNAHHVRIVHRIELPTRRSDEPRLGTDEVEALLKESVAQRVYADVPLGCFLSGGVDSSLVAHYAKESMGRLTTLCVRFEEGGFDESPYAEEVARIIGSDHITIDVRPSAADDFVSLLGLIGLPYADSSLLPTHWVCHAARQHVKVALAGDGGDELFFGYRRHKAALLLRKYRPLVNLLPRKLPGMKLNGGSTLSRLTRFLLTIRTLGYQSMLSWQTPDVVGLLPAEADRLFARTPTFPDPAMSDFQEYLLYDLMRKSDTASMAVPIEVRAPILSNGLIGAAQREPISSLMTNGQLKGILRDLLCKHLPARLVDRPKHGFGVPVGRFFKDDFGGMGSLLRDMLSGPEPFGPVHGVLDIDMRFVRGMIDDHMEGRREHSARLYTLVALAIWARQLGSPA